MVMTVLYVSQSLFGLNTKGLSCMLEFYVLLFDFFCFFLFCQAH